MTTDLTAENARLRAALEHIIAMNVREAKDRYGIEDRAESMACVVVARAALAAVQHESTRRWFQGDATPQEIMECCQMMEAAIAKWRAIAGGQP